LLRRSAIPSTHIPNDSSGMIDVVNRLKSVASGGRLELLDEFRLLWDSIEIKVAPGSAVVVAYLVARNRPVHRSVVAGTLWPALSDKRALASLRSALYRIPVPVVQGAGSMLRLSPELQIDIREAAELANEILGCRVPPTEIAEIIEVFSHELLPDSDAVWLEPLRQRHRSLRLRALSKS